MKTEFSPEWQHWIESNISNGQEKDYIFNLLIDEGYSYNSIKEEMQFDSGLTSANCAIFDKAC